MSHTVSSFSIESSQASAMLSPRAAFTHIPNLRARDQIRRELLELEMRNTKTSDFYREYTQYLIRKFANLKVVDGEDKVRYLKTFYANPERAIAKLKEDRNIVLPVGSIAFDRIEDDLVRRRVDTSFQNETAWNKKTRRAVRVVSLPPKAVVLSYMLHLYTKYTEDMAQLVEQVELMFNPAMDVKTSHSNSIKAYLGDIIDASPLQVSDREDRVIRRQIMINIETYIPTQKYMVTSTGEIEIVNQEITLDSRASEPRLN